MVLQMLIMAVAMFMLVEKGNTGCISDCYEKNKPERYDGSWNHAKDGRPCQPWPTSVKVEKPRMIDATSEAKYLKCGMHKEGCKIRSIEYFESFKRMIPVMSNESLNPYCRKPIPDIETNFTVPWCYVFKLPMKNTTGESLEVLQDYAGVKMLIEPAECDVPVCHNYGRKVDYLHWSAWRVHSSSNGQSYNKLYRCRDCHPRNNQSCETEYEYKRCSFLYGTDNQLSSSIIHKSTLFLNGNWNFSNPVIRKCSEFAQKPNKIEVFDPRAFTITYNNNDCVIKPAKRIYAMGYYSLAVSEIDTISRWRMPYFLRDRGARLASYDPSRKPKHCDSENYCEHNDKIYCSHEVFELQLQNYTYSCICRECILKRAPKISMKIGNNLDNHFTVKCKAENAFPPVEKDDWFPTNESILADETITSNKKLEDLKFDNSLDSDFGNETYHHSMQPKSPFDESKISKCYRQNGKIMLRKIHAKIPFLFKYHKRSFVCGLRWQGMSLYITKPLTFSPETEDDSDPSKHETPKKMIVAVCTGIFLLVMIVIVSIIFCFYCKKQMSGNDKSNMEVSDDDYVSVSDSSRSEFD